MSLLDLYVGDEFTVKGMMREFRLIEKGSSNAIILDVASGKSYKVKLNKEIAPYDTSKIVNPAEWTDGKK